MKGHFHFFLTRQSANVLSKAAPALSLLCAIVITLLLPIASYSQDTGYISGTVVDKSGAVRDHTEPACAMACPTDSIQFGPLDELRQRAGRRLEHLHDLGVEDARLYGHDEADGVGGAGAFFLLLDRPEVYGLPPDPVVGTGELPRMWAAAGAAALTLVASAVAAFAGGRR